MTLSEQMRERAIHPAIEDPQQSLALAVTSTWKTAAELVEDVAEKLRAEAVEDEAIGSSEGESHYHGRAAGLRRAADLLSPDPEGDDEESDEPEGEPISGDAQDMLDTLKDRLEEWFLANYARVGSWEDGGPTASIKLSLGLSEDILSASCTETFEDPLV